MENIYKRSFVTRTVLISWKRAKVTPIFKKEVRTGADPGMSERGGGGLYTIDVTFITNGVEGE